jgi:hypothetical protein
MALFLNETFENSLSMKVPFEKGGDFAGLGLQIYRVGDKFRKYVNKGAFTTTATHKYKIKRT